MALDQIPMSEPRPRPGIAYLSDAEFKDALAAVIPRLRAFARSLTGNRDIADDLVQESLLKAWAARRRFEAGTSMIAWTHTILRNLFRSHLRTQRLATKLDERRPDLLHSTEPNQEFSVELADIVRALQMLPPAQREALVLVGAGGFSYEEVANICDCATGTVKSRVARARAAVEHMLGNGGIARRRASVLAGSSPYDSILDEVRHLSGQAGR